MIKLGEMQELEVAKMVDFGVYLISSDDEKGEDRILLPIKQVSEDVQIGDKINVFVYRDSNDRIIATVRRPKIVIGEIAYLKVVEMSRIGAFMNWGLEKDLFLPFKEQVGDIKLNGEYLVGIYIDKSDRLCATMNLFNVLRTDSPYKVNDMVTGTVFSLKRGLGAMVAVEGKYLGLIHEGEILKPMRPGDVVEVRISNIKEDGKLDLSLKDAPRLQIDKDGEKLLSALSKNKGKLPLNDDSNPELINETLNMSKSSFKKAIGRLMKRGVIEMTREGICLADESTKKESKPRQGENNRTGHSNSRAGHFGNRSNNNSSYKTKDRTSNGSTYKTSDKTTNSSNYKTNDKTSNSSNYKTYDKTSNGSNYKTNDKTSNSPNYKTNDKASNSSNYKTNDKTSNGSNYKTSDRTSNNSNYRTNDKTSNNSNYKTNDRTSNSSNYKTNDRTSNKNNERNDSFNKRK